MAAIKYVNILNSVVSEEGSGGFLTNYIYYSLLIAYTDGTKKVVTVRDSEVSAFMPYVRTPMDDLKALQQQMDQLQSAVKQLRNDMTVLIDGNLDYVVDSMFPLPNVKDMEQEAASEQLQEEGFRVFLKKNYPKDCASLGRVLSCVRAEGDFRKATLELYMPVPELKGLRREEALALLERDCFQVTVRERHSDQVDDDCVIDWSREDPRSMELVLTVCRKILDVLGMDAAQALRLLSEHGNSVRCIKVFQPHGQWGRVLSCLPEEGEEQRLILRISADPASLPLTGMSTEEAERFLQENEVGFSVEHFYCSEPKERVFDWAWIHADRAEPSVELRVSDGPEVLKARSVLADWDDMKGSTGDDYEVQAIYKQIPQELVLKINYTNNTKNDRTLKAAFYGGKESSRQKKAQIYQDNSMISGEPGVFALTMRIEEPPRELTIQLVTQYGLLQKTEETCLQLTFQWD